MVRKLALALAGFWIGVAAPVWGLGLGDIHVSSALNQSFNGAIDLRDLGDLNPDEVIVTLGTAEDFARAKLERSFFLLDFRYQVQAKGSGTGLIRVTSSRPVTEPVVEFLVNVVWPNGRLQRQYTLLLDPPSNSTSISPSKGVAASVRPADNGGSNDSEQADTTPLAATRPAASQRVRRSTHSGRLKGDGYGPTDRDDTLWRIAARVRPSRDVTVHQTMLALQRLNPEAFIGANINRLKAGYKLRVPDAAQAQELGSSAAIAEVARQANSWRSGESTTPADSGAPVEGSAATSPAPKPAADRDEVRIVTGSKPKPDKTGGANTTPGGDELAEKLAGSKEEQDRLALENADSAKKLAQAAAQATQLQQQLAIRDQQAADLSRQMAAMRAAVEKAKTAPSATAQNSSGSVVSTPGFFEMWGKGLAAATVALFAGLVWVLYLYNRERTQVRLVARAKAEVDERLERTVRIERERTGNTVRPGAVAPTMAGAAAAAPVAAAALTAEPRPATRTPLVRPAPIPESDLVDTQDHEYLDKTVMLANPGEMARAAAADDVVAASDVVSEADIYIAYGRFPQAISFLQSALEKEPNRLDARLKLMEAYVETRDAAAFSLEAQTLLDRNPNEGELRRARQLQARLPGVSVIPGETIGESGVDFDKTIIDTTMADRSMPAGGLGQNPVELDLDLDHTDMLGEIEVDKPLDVDLSSDARAPTSADNLDFNLTLDGLDDDQNNQMGGDLGLSFRDDRAGEGLDRTQDAKPPSVDDDFGLDLTIDGRGTPIEPARRASRPPTSPDNDEGLSLTLDGKDDDFGAPVRPVRRDAEIIANADTVETTPIDEDLDFLSEAPDEARTKLDLARAYIDMGDGDAARDVLNEVLAEGSDSQQQEAKELLGKLA